jgi:hypothetical protein
MKTIVTLTPVNGEQIRYVVRGNVICTRINNMVLTNQLTLGKNDLVWKRVFGKDELNIFLSRGQTIKKIVSLSQLGYDQCDRVDRSY